jgi:hypothetical protein
MDNHQGDTMPQWATALLDQISHLQDTVRKLQDSTKEECTATPSTNSLEATTEHQVSQPTKQLAPLATFDGNREQLESWISQAEAKLRVDYNRCPEATQFFMIHNQLRGEAAVQLQPWVQDATNIGHMNVQGLINQLRLSFGDPHSKEKAQRKLHNLKQTHQSFMEYFTEYRKLALEAGGSNWPDEIKKSYLEAGLSIELQRCMIGKNTGNLSFEEYCSELKQASDQLEAFNLRNKNTWHNKATWQPRTVLQKGNLRTPLRDSTDRMDWEPTRTIQANQMITGKSRQRAKWVSPETIAYRREKNLCLRCGNPGHLIKDCKFFPAQRPLATNQSAVRHVEKVGMTADPTLPLADIEHPEDESGKE